MIDCGENVYYKPVSVIRTSYAGCRQEIVWCPKNISKGDKNGFIVQMVKRECSEEKITKSEQYFEAWRVKDNVVCDEPLEDSVYDDAFAVGIRGKNDIFKEEDIWDCAIESVDTIGYVKFSGVVYWISYCFNQDLFLIVDAWGRGCKSAGTLRSADSFSEAELLVPSFKRSFIHHWEFTDEELIFNELKKLMINMPRKTFEYHLTRLKNQGGLKERLYQYYLNRAIER